MRILLLNPPPEAGQSRDILGPPLGLAYLAAALEAAGQEVEILDAFALGLPWNELAGFLDRSRPDLVGIGGMTPIISASYRAAKIARPFARWLVLGGPHVSAVRGKVFEEAPEFDFALAGEAEETFPALCRALAGGQAPGGEIPGLLSPQSENPGSPIIQDLDRLPLPARRLLPNSRYRHPLFGGEPIATVMTSRGCPYGCVFCDKAVSGRNWRPRSADHVLDELEQIVKELGIRSLIFYDDLFTLDPARAIQIARGMLERKLDLRWKCEGRVNLVHEEALAWMKRAGCEMIAYGVETPNEQGLKFLHKGISAEQSAAAFARTRAAGIQTLAYFILGIPGETFADELQTIRFARAIGADYAQFALLSPFPGTPLYQEAVSRGWYRQGPALGLAEQGAARPRLLTEEWTEERLRAIQRRAYTGFYLRPGYLLKRLYRLKSGREFFAGLRSGFELLRWRFLAPRRGR
jgi:radical SAM superfamily enzyme YgiQ (UPF0313 family)